MSKQIIHSLLLSCVVLAGCERSRSTNGSGVNTPDIEYSAPDRLQPELARVMAVVETSVFRQYYKKLISKITIMEGTRPAEYKQGVPVLGYLGWIKGSHVRLAGDSLAALTDRQIDYLIAHEAEHRSEGLVTGYDDPEHATPDQCLPDRGDHPKCHYAEAVKLL